VFDLPAAYIRDVVVLAGRWNVPASALLADLPLREAELTDPTTRVPLRVAEAIVLRALELTREPALAFHMGVQMRLSSHGFLGFAAMTSGTARAALELAVRFASTRTSAIGLALYVEGDTASLVIEERTPLGGLREFAVLALIVGIWQIGLELTGKMLDGHGDCGFPEPEFVRALPLGGRLRFDQPAHRLVFPATLLDLPFRTADALATRLAIEQCERELAAIDTGVVGRVRGLLAGERVPTLPDAARELHVSPRTLKRKLAEHGTTFSALRDDVLRQRALLLLDSRALSIGEIATRLGYTELPSFTRAFRKWTGMTPHAYRARHGA
jgi:AraC-like DNA-binding protein